MLKNLRYRKLVLVALMLGSYVWVLFAIILPVPIDLNTELGRRILALNLGSIFGLLGAVLLWWQFVLGARGLVAKFIPDLIWVNNLHKRIGKYGFLQISLHPIIILLAYNEPLSYWIQFDTPFDYYLKFGTLAYLLVTVLWITGAFFRKKLGYRNWKRLHFIAYAVVPLVLIHGLNVGTLVNHSPLLYNTWLFLLAGYVLVLIYRVLSQLGVLKLKYELVGKTTVTANVTKFDFAPKGKGIVPLAGQFLYIQFSKFGEAHPFTISHYDRDSQIISLSIKSSGKFTSEITEIPVGATVYLDGPFGVYTQELPTLENPLILIAGGIGITPYVRHLDYLSNQDKPVFLFYGNQTRADIAFEAEVNQAINNYFKVIHVLSNEQIEGLAHGFVTIDLIKQHAGTQLPDYSYFITGPKPMMDALIAGLKGEGVSSEQIFIEEFSL